MLATDWMADQQDQRIAETVRQEQGRLWNFIRRRVPDAGDAEDILQSLVVSKLISRPLQFLDLASWHRTPRLCRLAPAKEGH